MSDKTPVKRKAGRPHGSKAKLPTNRQLMNVFAQGAYKGALRLLSIIEDEKATDTAVIAAAKKMIDVKIALEQNGGVFLIKKDEVTGKDVTTFVEKPQEQIGFDNVISTNFGG